MAGSAPEGPATPEHAIALPFTIVGKSALDLLEGLRRSLSQMVHDSCAKTD